MTSTERRERLIRMLYNKHESIGDLAIEIEALFSDDWIPVSERLPEETGRYWCYVESVGELGVSHEQVNCSYSERHGFMENGKIMNVTHWRPLPEAPKFKPT